MGPIDANLWVSVTVSPDVDAFPTELNSGKLVVPSVSMQTGRPATGESSIMRQGRRSFLLGVFALSVAGTGAQPVPPEIGLRISTLLREIYEDIYDMYEEMQFRKMCENMQQDMKSDPSRYRRFEELLARLVEDSRQDGPATNA